MKHWLFSPPPPPPRSGTPRSSQASNAECKHREERNGRYSLKDQRERQDEEHKSVTLAPNSSTRRLKFQDEGGNTRPRMRERRSIDNEPLLPKQVTRRKSESMHGESFTEAFRPRAPRQGFLRTLVEDAMDKPSTGKRRHAAEAVEPTVEGLLPTANEGRLFFHHNTHLSNPGANVQPVLPPRPTQMLASPSAANNEHPGRVEEITSNHSIEIENKRLRLERNQQRDTTARMIEDRNRMESFFEEVLKEKAREMKDMSDSLNGLRSCELDVKSSEMQEMRRDYEKRFKRYEMQMKDLRHSHHEELKFQSENLQKREATMLAKHQDELSEKQIEIMSLEQQKHQELANLRGRLEELEQALCEANQGTDERVVGLEKVMDQEKEKLNHAFDQERQAMRTRFEQEKMALKLIMEKEKEDIVSKHADQMRKHQDEKIEMEQRNRQTLVATARQSETEIKAVMEQNNAMERERLVKHSEEQTMSHRRELKDKACTWATRIAEMSAQHEEELRVRATEQNRAELLGKKEVAAMCNEMEATIEKLKLEYQEELKLKEAQRSQLGDRGARDLIMMRDGIEATMESLRKQQVKEMNGMILQMTNQHREELSRKELDFRNREDMMRKDLGGIRSQTNEAIRHVRAQHDMEIEMNQIKAEETKQDLHNEIHRLKQEIKRMSGKDETLDSGIFE